MPSPLPVHDAVLKYLRYRYPYREQLRLRDGRCWAYEDVRTCLNELIPTLDDDGLRILICYAWEPWERLDIIQEVGYDGSTVKRRLDSIVDKLVALLERFPSNLVFEGPKAKILRPLILHSMRDAMLTKGDWVVLWEPPDEANKKPSKPLESVPYEEWRVGLKNLQENAPDFARVLNLYARKLEGGRLIPVAKVAKVLEQDSSTVRRKLYVSLDTILQHVRHREVFCRPKLFPYLNASDEVIGYRAWPFQHAWSQLRHNQ